MRVWRKRLRLLLLSEHHPQWFMTPVCSRLSGWHCRNSPQQPVFPFLSVYSYIPWKVSCITQNALMQFWFVYYYFELSRDISPAFTASSISPPLSWVVFQQQQFVFYHSAHVQDLFLTLHDHDQTLKRETKKKKKTHVGVLWLFFLLQCWPVSAGPSSMASHWKLETRCRSWRNVKVQRVHT